MIGRLVSATHTNHEFDLGQEDCVIGRASDCDEKDNSGSRTLNTRTTLRMALKLPENFFQIDRKKNGFVFRGRGFGHGVGYSQWGSAFMSEDKAYSEILMFYYPGTRIEKKW